MDEIDYGELWPGGSSQYLKIDRVVENWPNEVEVDATWVEDVDVCGSSETGIYIGRSMFVTACIWVINLQP